MSSSIETRLLDGIRQNPLASQQQLADQLGISRESVAGHIMRLTRQGKILGKGYLLPEGEQIVVLGGANVDLTGQSAAPFLAGDSNPGSLRQSAGGVGRNIAENLARLGHNVSLISLIGRDPSGDWLVERIRQAGIATDGLLRDGDLPTSTYLAVNDANGQLIGAIADMGISEALTPQRLTPVQSRLVAASSLVVEANLSAATLGWLATLPLRGGLYADAVSATKAPRLRPLLSKLAALKVNRHEAAAILDAEGLDDRELIAGLHNAGVKLVVLSLGRDGVRLSCAGKQHQQAPFQVSVHNDTGAGDALFAGILHAALGGDSLANQAKFGLACAGLTLESDSANHPELTETSVQQWIANR